MLAIHKSFFEENCYGSLHDIVSTHIKFNHFDPSPKSADPLILLTVVFSVCAYVSFYLQSFTASQVAQHFIWLQEGVQLIALENYWRGVRTGFIEMHPGTFSFQTISIFIC